MDLDPSLSPSRGEVEETRLLDWKDVAPRVEDLKAGDIVSGFSNLSELDIFVTHVGDYLCKRPYREDFDPSKHFNLDSKGGHTYLGWQAKRKPPSEIMKPPRFFGKVKNIMALMLEDVSQDLSGYQIRGVRLGLFAEMESRGRGLIGRIAKESRVGIISFDVNQYITTSYKNLLSNNAEAAAEQLNLEAAQTATKVIMYGLRRIYSGGLPGLGKRR